MANVKVINLNEVSHVISIQRKHGQDKLAEIELIQKSDKEYEVKIEHSCHAVYGMGERFNCVNQKGKKVHVEVIEKFCNQGAISYCPIPFFFTDNQLGVFMDTKTVTEFDFQETIKINLTKDTYGKLPSIYLMEGEPKEILHEYTEITGKPKLTPKWSFGPWMSANRWKTQEETLKQLEQALTHGIPHSVMVLEAWSDEATFYLFNNNGEWRAVESLMQKMKELGVHLILWQIPVLKKLDPGQRSQELDSDWNYAIENDLCIKNMDGSTYSIPEDHWFAGSLLPDFTNPKTKKWWFKKRQYLLDLGVDGFKTDGGEFILTDQVTAFNGMTGLELRNFYSSNYVQAYSEFIGSERVLFSRAGYIGQQNYPMQWAGDQMSTWEEFRNVIKAGLSIGLSGVPFWGFDIGGFAGELPEKELYERSVQTAVFAPIMQWHSEPVGGQFSEVLAVTKGVNDRSPWNISLLYEDDGLLERCKFHFNLRMNLLPYIYHQAMISARTGLPLMKHLICEYTEEKVKNVEDCFMLGDLLVAPILQKGQKVREIYLPEGMWTSFWPLNMVTEAGKKEHILRLKGKNTYSFYCDAEKIPVFVRDGGCIPLNLNESFELGSSVLNDMNEYKNLCFYLYGKSGEYLFEDDFSNIIKIHWKNKKVVTECISGNQKFRVFHKPL